MYQAITVPVVEGFRRQESYSRQWEHPEGDAEAGLGQVIERSHFSGIKKMDAPSIAPDVYFHQWLVEEGEPVRHGKAVAEIVVDNVVVQVVSFLDGVVSGLVDWSENDRVPAGKILANIVSRRDRTSAKSAGLVPKPSPALRMRRQLGIATSLG